MSSTLPLLSLVAGTGLPCAPSPSGSATARVLAEIDALSAHWQAPDAQTARTLLNGDWRLVWSSSDALRLMSDIPGGPVEAVYESVADSCSHTTALSKAPLFGLLFVLTLAGNLMISLVLPLGFFGGVLLSLLTYYVLASAAPRGLYVSRRADVALSDELVVTSRLERQVIVFRAGPEFAERNPMTKFVPAFDASPSARDSLGPGFLFGWRMALRPWALHVRVSSRTQRRERLVYLHDNVRIMEGGDVLSDGHSTSVGTFVYVRV